MPIRVVCPACSATLSVKDEFAGRAVKCPKCGGVIPPSEPVAPPPPEPEQEPEESSKSGTGSKATKSADEDDPPRRNDRDEDDRSSKKRESKKRRRDDDNDDRPSRGEKKGGSGVIIVLVICGALLLCCGGTGLGAWFFVLRVQDKIEQVQDDLKKDAQALNVSVNKPNFDRLTVGSTTRDQAEVILGSGRMATGDDIEKVFGNDKSTIASWKNVVNQGRAVIWQNGDDYILAMFHPNANPDARLQMKQWKPKIPPGTSDGSSDDVDFVRSHPAKKGTNPKGKGKDKDLTPETKVKAEDLASDFKNDQTAAAQKYVGKTFTVDGKLKDIEVIGGETRVILEGGPSGPDIACPMNKTQNMAPFNYSRGQQMRFEGQCVGATASTVSFTSCTIRGADNNPTPEMTPAVLIAAYNTVATGDARYKDKWIRVTTAEVEKMPSDGTVVVVPFGKIPGGKGPAKKIRVEYDPLYKPLYPKLRVGALVTIHGKCEGVSGGEIVIKDAWFSSYIP